MGAGAPLGPLNVRQLVDHFAGHEPDGEPQTQASEKHPDRGFQQNQNHDRGRSSRALSGIGDSSSSGTMAHSIATIRFTSCAVSPLGNRNSANLPSPSGHG